MCVSRHLKEELAAVADIISRHGRKIVAIWPAIQRASVIKMVICISRHLKEVLAWVVNKMLYQGTKIFKLKYVLPCGPQ